MCAGQQFPVQFHVQFQYEDPPPPLTPEHSPAPYSGVATSSGYDTVCHPGCYAAVSVKPPRSAAPENCAGPFQLGTVNAAWGCTSGRVAGSGPAFEAESDLESESAAHCRVWCSSSTRRISCRRCSCSTREVRSQYSWKPAPQTVQRIWGEVWVGLHRTCMSAPFLYVRE